MQRVYELLPENKTVRGAFTGALLLLPLLFLIGIVRARRGKTTQPLFRRKK
jgi:hypothetical protein